jgi:hypothetical protein
MQLALAKQHDKDRSFTTFGQADDLVYEFANYTATPGRPA